MNKNIDFNLKGILFSFLVCIFALFGFQNFCNAETITLTDPAKISEIKLKNEDILKLDKGISSFDLSTLPAITEKIQIAMETVDTVDFKGKVPENYDLQLLILHNSMGTSEKDSLPKTLSAFYVNKGTEKNPDVLDLYSSEFNLNLLPPASSIHSLSDGQKASLCVMDGSSIEGIEFSGALPDSYNVAEIFILSEKDKDTFKEAFPNSNINVSSEDEINKKFSECFNTSSDTSTSESKSEKNSDTTTPASYEKSSSKETGDSFGASALSVCFLSFGLTSFVLLLKKRQKN